MKILGLVASPRKLGNSEILVKEMLASFSDDVEKEMIRLPELNIEPCKACYACLPQENECIIKDDLAFLLKKIEEADGIVIGSPCYFLGVHSSLKLVGDRFISILNSGNKYSGKKCVLAIVYGIKGWEGYAREGAISFAKFLHLDVVGTMLVQAANPGQVIKDDTLAEARELAQALITPKKVLSESNIHTCPHCDSSLLQLGLGGEVRCIICGTTGKIRNEQEKPVIDFDKKVPGRFTKECMNKHGKLLEQIKEEFIKSRTQLYELRKPYKDYDWWIKP